MILLVDNYDSFVYNLHRYLVLLGQEVVVQRNDHLVPDAIQPDSFEAIVLSPGPQSPDEAGKCLELVLKLYERVPLLGVCLGHQIIWQALGGRIVRARQPTHGRTSKIRFTDRPIFGQLENPFVAARYHSLAADPNFAPQGIEVTAWSDDGEIMGFEHHGLPVFGWQFHPESILTKCGYQLLANFLRLAKVKNLPTALPPSDLVLVDSWPEVEAAVREFAIEPETSPVAVIPGSAW